MRTRLRRQFSSDAGLAATHLQLLTMAQDLVPERLTMTETVLVSAVHQEVSELTMDNGNRLGYGDLTDVAEPMRIMTPSYLLRRYPLLGLTSTDQVAKLRRRLVRLGVLVSKGEGVSVLGLSVQARVGLFSSLANLRASTFLLVPQYALATHETLWQLSMTHVLLGTAAVRLLRARHYSAPVDVNTLLDLTQVLLEYRQALRYVQDLVELRVLEWTRPYRPGQHLWLRPGDHAAFLLVESREVALATAPAWRTSSARFDAQG